MSSAKNSRSSFSPDEIRRIIDGLKPIQEDARQKLRPLFFGVSDPQAMFIRARNYQNDDGVEQNESEERK